MRPFYTGTGSILLQPSLGGLSRAGRGGGRAAGSWSPGVYLRLGGRGGARASTASRCLAELLGGGRLPGVEDHGDRRTAGWRSTRRGRSRRSRSPRASSACRAGWCWGAPLGLGFSSQRSAPFPRNLISGQRRLRVFGGTGKALVCWTPVLERAHVPADDRHGHRGLALRVNPALTARARIDPALRRAHLAASVAGGDERGGGLHRGGSRTGGGAGPLRAPLADHPGGGPGRGARGAGGAGRCAGGRRLGRGVCVLRARLCLRAAAGAACCRRGGGCRCSPSGSSGRRGRRCRPSAGGWVGPFRPAWDFAAYRRGVRAGGGLYPRRRHLPGQPDHAARGALGGRAGGDLCRPGGAAAGGERGAGGAAGGDAAVALARAFLRARRRGRDRGAADEGDGAAGCRSRAGRRAAGGAGDGTGRTGRRT